jgi:hypothetical protein
MISGKGLPLEIVPIIKRGRSETPSPPAPLEKAMEMIMARSM